MERLNEFTRKFFGASPQLVIYMFHQKNRFPGVILLGAPKPKWGELPLPNGF